MVKGSLEVTRGMLAWMRRRAYAARPAMAILAVSAALAVLALAISKKVSDLKLIMFGGGWRRRR